MTAAYRWGLQSVSRAITESPTSVSTPTESESGAAGCSVGGDSEGGGTVRSPHANSTATAAAIASLAQSARRRTDLIAKTMRPISRSVASRASIG